jgi:hypothetical protein
MHYIELNPRSGDDGGGSGALSLDKLSSQRLRTNVAAVSPPLDLPSLDATDKARQAAYRHLFWYHLDEEMVSELRLAASTKISPSGTSVSLRRLSAWLGSIVRQY